MQIVESMLGRVMQEFERRIASQNEQVGPGTFIIDTLLHSSEQDCLCPYLSHDLLF